jgi:hypothetical protein
MLMLHPPSPLSPGAEHGTSLMEMLVAMLTAIIVLGALLATLEFSLTQEAQTSERVQANRVGRIAMTKMVDELHSGCTGFGATAIQAPATVTAPLATTGPVDLWFLSAYGNASSGSPVPIPSLHDLHWQSTGKLSNTGLTLGTLTDYAFANEAGGEAPSWKFAKLEEAKVTTKRALAYNVIPPAVEVEGKKTLFQYYKYNASGELTLLKASEVSTASTENEIAKVSINFTQASETADTRPGRTAAFSNSVVLRFNLSETGSEANDHACV